MKKKSMDWYKQQQRFSVRKYHFGAASVLLGTALVFGGAQASADEVTAPATPSTESTTAASAETTTTSEGAPAVLTASEATPASLTASEASSSTEATSLDKGALQLALSQAKALDLSNKTSETVAILLAQIEHAQTVLNTATSQEELNQAVADLQAAQAQLADKPAESSKPAVASTEAAQPATTPVSVTPATPTGSEVTSQPSEKATSEEVAQPSHGKRSRRDLSAVTPAAATPAAVTPAASVHTPVEVASTSTGTITIGPDISSRASAATFNVNTKLTQPAVEGDFVEYSYEGLAVDYLNGKTVSANGTVIGVISDTILNDEAKKSFSKNPTERNSATYGSRSGKLRVTFNKNVENLTNIDYNFGLTNAEFNYATGTTNWSLTSSIRDKNGVIASTVTNIPAAQTLSVGAGNESYAVVLNRVALSDNIYRGDIRPVFANSATKYLKPGDTLSYTLDPSSVIRFDLSSDKMKVGYKENRTDYLVNVINPNNVYVTSGKELEFELINVSDTKAVYKIVKADPGEAYFITSLPVVVTDLNGVDAVNKRVGPVSVTENIMNQSGAATYYGTQTGTLGIYGIVAAASAVQVPRADVYVQYVDEAGNLIPGTTKTLVLDDAKTGTAYTTTGLDSNTYPNYTFVKMQDGSAPATGNSTTADIVVTYVYHYNTEAERFTPNGQDLTVKHNDTPSAEDGIANKTDLPTGTTYAWKGTAPDTSTPGTKPATITVSYPDGSSEDVNVNVNVTPRADDYTPVGKDVPAKHGDTPSAASGIANKGDLPADATYTWKGTAPDTTTPGDKPATVVVTYDDGTVDEVPVTVKVQPQADDYDPQAQPVSVDHGATPNAEDGIANKGTLPPGTTYDWKTPIDTSTPGTKPGTVVVTYPDGTKDEVPVPVTVGEEAALYTPVGQDVPAKHGETPAASQGIANRGTLPAGTTYDWKTPVDTTTPGDKPATVVVTYPDGSKDEVPVTVKVKPQSDEFTPNGQDVPTKHGETPNAADGIANKGDLPAGTTYDWKTPVDTSTPGDKPGTVVVTYPDGTKDEVPVTVKVKPQSDEFTPVGKDVPAKHGDTPNAADGISNKGDLPAGTTYDWKTPVDTSTPGDKPGTVVVTYPDGTKDEVPVTVKVQPQTDDYDPQAKPVAVDHGATPNAEDGIANKGDLPAGTTYDWKTPVDTSTPGTKPGTVVVTYPDGTKDEVPVPVTVGEQADLYTPVGQDVPAKHGETPAASQGIANRGTLPAGTTYDWKTPVDTSTPGDKPATVVVTYPDGTKDEVPVTVKVKPQSDEFTPAGQDVPTKHGETPNAADGIANKGDLPAGTTYDWKTPVDTTTPGDKPGTVVVTYPDGTKDEVPVTGKVKPQSDEFTPNGQDVPAKHGETPKAEDGIANKGDLPDGTKFDWKTPVDTTTPGDKSGTVVVTYPDGTKDEVPVTVKVKPQSDEFTPQPKDVSTDHGKTPKAEDGIANKGDLPDGTKYDWKTPVDTTTPGDKPGTVVVTYPDGTKDEVPVTVHVGSQSDLYNPDGQNLNVKQGDQPEASKGIANRGNLPDGTTYDWKTPVDTSTVGDKPATVVVTYPDGSKDEVPVTVKVTEKLHVKTPADKVPVKDPSHLTPDDINKVVENIKKENPGLPDDAKITVNPNGGDTTIETKDGDKVTIPGSDLVRPETDADKNNVKVPADKVPVKDPSNLTDAEKDKVKDNIKKANPDLPNGTKIDVAKDGTATITFPDGSTKVIPGSDLVRPETDADRHTPKGQDVPVKQGETPKAEDGIANKGDLPNGTKIEWKETPDTSKVGDHNATIVITYPDGSKDEVTVTVKVSPNANNNGHNGNNGSHGNGNSGSHNNGTNGDQGQGDKDKKDQAGKDTNNGLDKLFSNSGNGSASGDQSAASRKQAPALPNTGDASNPAMGLAFAALLGGTALAMKKRKKEEEE